MVLPGGGRAMVSLLPRTTWPASEELGDGALKRLGVLGGDVEVVDQLVDAAGGVASVGDVAEELSGCTRSGMGGVGRGAGIRGDWGTVA